MHVCTEVSCAIPNLKTHFRQIHSSATLNLCRLNFHGAKCGEEAQPQSITTPLAALGKPEEFLCPYSREPAIALVLGPLWWIRPAFDSIELDSGSLAHVKRSAETTASTDAIGSRARECTDYHGFARCLTRNHFGLPPRPFSICGEYNTTAAPKNRTCFKAVMASDATRAIWLAEDEANVRDKGCIFAARIGNLEALQ